MKHSVRYLAVVAVAFFAVSGLRAADPPAASVSPDDALQRLTEGNKRFVSGNLEHPRQTTDRRTEVAGGQAPFAIVLACADSRTAPELLFDQGLGDLFVVRVAGNIANNEGIGSIEYAVAHLGTRLIIVLGHEKCGAVQAARDAIAAKQTVPAHIDSLVAAIKPAVDKTATADLETTVKANAEDVAQKLRASEPVLKPMIDKREVVVKSAYYDLDTGAVSFLDAK